MNNKKSYAQYQPFDHAVEVQYKATGVYISWTCRCDYRNKHEQTRSGTYECMRCGSKKCFEKVGRKR